VRQRLIGLKQYLEALAGADTLCGRRLAHGLKVGGCGGKFAMTQTLGSKV
jgi:hypothetical protein